MYKPYQKMMHDHPHMALSQPFECVYAVCTSVRVFLRLRYPSRDRFKVKDVKFSYHVEEVFNIDIPNLQHGNDGLIYTSVNTPYLPGTDKNMCVCSRALSYHTRALTNSETTVLNPSLKWKPPSENSIDFKLVLRFPCLPARPREPDYFAKPVFELHVFCGDRSGIAQYEMYDVLRVDDNEWER